MRNDRDQGKESLDILIADEYGSIVVNYTYDAWGNILSITGSLASTIGNINPIRYRSYYYDTETGFYYLQTRYYDPAIRRFINADGYVNANGDILGFNMYAYCGNNPVMYVDYTGEAFLSALWIGAGAKALCTYIAQCLVAYGIVAIATSPGFQDALTDACTGIANAVTDAVENVKEKVEEKIDAINAKYSKTYVVYGLMDSKGNIQYVGRTSDLDKRLNAHANSEKNKDLVLAWSTPPLKYCEARGLEQLGIIGYNTLNLAKDMNLFGRNWINGIADTNVNKFLYMKAAMNFIYNEITNEYLNSIGS